MGQLICPTRPTLDVDSDISSWRQDYNERGRTWRPLLLDLRLKQTIVSVLWIWHIISSCQGEYWCALTSIALEYFLLERLPAREIWASIN